MSHARSHMCSALMTRGWKWGAIAVRLLVWKLELSGWNLCPTWSPSQRLSQQGQDLVLPSPMNVLYHWTPRSIPCCKPRVQKGAGLTHVWRHWTQATWAMLPALKPRNSRLPLGTQLPLQTSRPPLSIPSRSRSCLTLCPCAPHTLSPAELSSVDASKKCRERRAFLHFSRLTFVYHLWPARGQVF